MRGDVGQHGTSPIPVTHFGGTVPDSGEAQRSPIAQLEDVLRRLVTACEEIGVQWSVFLQHARTADELTLAVRSEAAEDRIKASDLIRVEEHLKAAKAAMAAMMQSVKQASVGSLL